MLSAESAAGKYPEQAVAMMHAIAMETESKDEYRDAIKQLHLQSPPDIAFAITASVREIAETTDIKAICCFSQSGTTAILAARERPCVPILALTNNRNIARQLSLVWGLRCIVVDPVDRFRHAVKAAINTARACGVACGSEQIVITAGIPFNTPGSTNILRVASVDASDINLGT
ncbi:MAG: pyruvate kinase alpha/beta domain-containing protein, partial [Pseudomonadota bacterium]